MIAIRRAGALGWFVTAFVIAVIVAGLYVAGSPALARARRMDQQRIEDLGQITDAVREHFTGTGKLPKSLGEITPAWRVPTDPSTGRSYGYRVVDTKRFELTANFETEVKSAPQYGYYGSQDISPLHPKGEYRYVLTAKRQR